VLVARKGDADKATAMWRRIVAFRKERGCAALLDGPAVYREPEVMRRYFPWGFVGTDRDGFPVLVERVGQIDLIGIGAATGGPSAGYADFLSWVCWYHEVQEALMGNVSRALGRDRRKMTVVIDMAGLGLRHCSSATLAVLQRRTRLEEDNYPEVVRRVILINTPSIFATVWGVIVGFMDPGTSGKLQAVGANFLPTLRRFIADDNIPAWLGGDARDAAGDAQCAGMVCPGGVVPLSYLHPAVSGDGRGAGEEVAVPAGRASELLIAVPPGATVRWAWALADKDIEFSAAAAPAPAALPPGAIAVTRSVIGAHCEAPGFDDAGAPNPYKPAPGAPGAPGAGGATPLGAGEAPAAPTARAAAGAGSYTAPPAGGRALVRLRWDNSSSWMTGKTLARRVDVVLAADAARDAAERAAPPPRGAPGAIHRARDPGDEAARARAEHRDRIVAAAGKRTAA